MRLENCVLRVEFVDLIYLYVFSFQASSNDLRINGNIMLSIKRAPISLKKCAYPFCDERENLHIIPIAVRYKLIHELRFYVPPRGVACENHGGFEQWKEEDIRDCENIPYTVANIEDMFELLRLKPKSLKYEHKGMHSIDTK